MEFIINIVNHILHVDKFLGEIIKQYDSFTYVILFTVIFCETGLVVTPFLPGDSLLFAIGAFSAKGSLNIFTIYTLLLMASLIGDNVNYCIGKLIGPKIFGKDNVKFLKKEYLTKTHEFYEKHGGKTIIIAKFMPIIRTFAPFVAGIGKMTYIKFITYDVISSFLWISIFMFAGYFLGSLEFVKNNFTIIIFGIIGVSMLPAIITFIKAKMNTSKKTKISTNN